MLANGQYQGGTFINGRAIYSPQLIGDEIILTDGNSFEVGKMSLKGSNTWAFDLSSNLSLRMSAKNGNVYLHSSIGPSLLLGIDTDTGRKVCSFSSGCFILGSDSWGNTLPTTGQYGQIFFKLK